MSADRSTEISLTSQFMIDESSVCDVCSCSSVEEKLNMPEGVLKKVVKTKEEKQRELQEVTSVCFFHSLFVCFFVVLFAV